MRPRHFFSGVRSGTLWKLLAAGASLLGPQVGQAALPIPPSAERAVFAQSIRALPTVASDPAGRPHPAFVSRAVLRAEETAAAMTFEVALKLRHFDELEARLARSEIIAPAEMQARYLPLAADHDRIVRWLQAEGVTVTRTDANHLAVFARASVAEVGRIFQTSFARVTSGAAEYTSAVAPPSVPAHLAPAIRGIHGLQPHQRLRRRPQSALQPLAGTGNLLPYYPAQLAKAYNASGLAQTGAGQTIAVYSLAFPRTTDLTTFWSLSGVAASAANIQNIKVAGGPAASTSSGSAREATLDVEWASALAPGAVIRVYAADENDPVGDDELIQEILADLPSQPNLHQLTISYGADESTSDRDYIAIEAQYMAALVSAGVTVFAASGDAGALGNDGTIQTGYPASMPDVTAVGGTTLTLDTSGNVASETAWGTLTNSGSSGSSGGGVSIVFNRPAWQTGLGVAAGTMRLVPDVAAVADPGTGGLIVYSGRSSQIGGTSLSSPMWAAWCALINQARASAGKAPLGALNPRLYPLAGTAAFRDITSGGNSVFQAGAGYDLATGLGVPNVAALMQATMADQFAPVIEVQSGGRFTTVGQGATFYVVATGNPSPSYRWQRRAAGTSSWIDLTDSATYVGSRTYALSIFGATLAMSGDQFQCVLSDGSSIRTSQPDTLTVGTVGVATVAGWPGWSGFANGRGSAGRFNYTGSVRLDSAGVIYVADASNHTVRKITPDGNVTTLAGSPGNAGSADGIGTAARFNGPAGVAIDSAGNVFVADALNYTIRKITPAGAVTTLAGSASVRGRTDGTGSAASFYDPENLTIDAAGNLFVADGAGNIVRKVTPSGVVTTLAGAASAGTVDGTGSAARFNLLGGIAVDAAGNVYVGDTNNNAVRKITPAGVVTTLAGRPGTRNFGSTDGTGTNARFNYPAGLAVDGAGNVYVADSLNNAIRQITAAGVVTTLSGSASVAENIDGPLSVARFNSPADVALGPDGALYVADALNCTIRRIALDTSPVTSGPQSVTVNLGQNATFSVTAQGAGPFTYQWQQLAAGSANWVDLADVSGFVGAKTATLSVNSPTVALDGMQVRCLVGNSGGAATSSAASLFVLGPPFIATAPGAQSQSVLAGGAVTLSVSAAGRGLAFQWQFNGAAIAGATGPSLALANFQAANAGSYTVMVSNASGSTTTSVATLSLASAFLANLSVRANVGTGGNVLIVGMVVGGSGNARILLRGAGPALAPFGVTGALAAPVLTLSGPDGAAIATNSGWGNSATLTAAFDQVGAFAFPANSTDTALLQPLGAGSYTAEISGLGGTTGVALAEVYDTDSIAVSARPRNISSRAIVGSGGDLLIAGFVVGGSGTERLLVRAAGPGLVQFGVAGVLANPVLSVLDASGKTLATNAGWGGAANLAGAAAQVGAFPFVVGAADSALLLTVPAGAYTAQVSGAGGTTGVALIEVYELTP